MLYEDDEGAASADERNPGERLGGFPERLGVELEHLTL